MVPTVGAGGNAFTETFIVFGEDAVQPFVFM
jgi:hypothetical protein